MSSRPNNHWHLSAASKSEYLPLPKTVQLAGLPLSTPRRLVVMARLCLRKINVLCAASIGSLWATAALGQLTTGSVIGSILDTQSNALAGVAVTIASDELPGGAREFVTDLSGQFRFPSLPPGLYDLTASLPEFGTYLEEDFRVNVGKTTERLITLELAAISETVTVTAKSPLVDSRKSGVSTNFSSNYLRNTPLRRFSFFDFTKTAPGMSATNPTSGSSSRVSAFGSGVD